MAAAALIALAVLVPTGSAGADELSDARARLADARAAASQASAELNVAKNKLAELDGTISDIQARIDAQRAKAAELQDIARRRALYAYKNASGQLDIVVSADDPVEAARRTTLLEHANQNDNKAVKDLAAINADLHEEELQLKAQRAQQQQVKDQADAKNRELQAKLAEAQRAADALEAKLAAEQARAKAEEAARIAAERAQLARSTPLSNTGPGQILVNPGGGSFMCPVAGAAYSNDYGGARNHQGIDMFVPTGTPEVAVKGGEVRYVPFEGAGGNTAYLYANDGNVYFYAHMSAFAGGARSVSQGEVLGFAGMTGNASGPHLHFEIRVGGVNGTRINPYPTLKSTGC